MSKRSGIKNPAVFAIISFVAIIGVSFMLVFSAVASSNSSVVKDEPAEEAVAAETTAAQIETQKAVQAPVKETVVKEMPIIEAEEPAADAEEPAEIEEVPEADTDEEAVDSAVEEAAHIPSLAFITEDQVNFRSAPDSDNNDNIIFVLYYGSTHDVVSVDGAWTCINVDGFGEGYVYSNFVSLTDEGTASTYSQVLAAANGAAAAGNSEMGLAEYEEEEDFEEYDSEPAEEDSLAEYAVITDDQVNFRSSQNTGSSENIICTLNAGSAHYLLDIDSGWAMIYVDGFGEGYVSTAFTEFTDNAEITYYDEIVAASAAEGSDSEDYAEEEYVDPDMALRQQVVDYACSFAGWLPYVWGSHSLTYGADCSGFTSAVYAQFGYSLSCDSEVQSRQGYSVPLSEILPGDIIVYSGHVAMYVGDGLKVHSPYPGTVVTIDSAYYTTILDVRRIIG